MIFGGVLIAAAALTAVADALPSSAGKAVARLGQRLARPTVFVSLAGSDTTCARGNASKPCATFQRAYEIARQGDVVQVAGGEYPGQMLSWMADKTSAAGNCRLLYKPNETFASSTAGCVTFESAPGAHVQIGAHTMTTSNLDLSTTSTIPVVSTAGFYRNSGSDYSLTLGRSRWTCTGKDANAFTGCSPQVPCTKPTGGQLCGWDSGTDLIEGGLAVTGASYLDFKGMSIAGNIAVGRDGTHLARDVLFDDVSAAFGYWSGANLYIENSALGSFDGSQENTISNSDHVGIYNTVVRGERDSHCDGKLSGQTTNYYCHGDGVYANGDSNLYFVHSAFVDNDPFHIFFSHGGARVNPGPVTIADNYFGSCGPQGCAAAVSIRGDMNDTLKGYTIEGNTSTSGWLIGANSGQDNVSLDHWVIEQNVFGRPMCPTEPSGWTGRFDVRFVNNISPIECSHLSGPVAAGNQTLGDLGIGAGGTLWVEAAAHWQGAAFGKPKPQK